MYFQLFLVFVLVLICVITFLDVWKPYLYPPGPFWWPIIGSLPQVKIIHTKKRYQYLVWAHFRETYGSIIGLKLGSSRIVVVSGYEEINEMLRNDVFQGRPDGFFFRLRSFGQRLGIVFVDGPFAQEQRKFCMNVLRRLGMGTITMNDVIINEIQEVIQHIKSKCEDGPFDPQQLFNISTLNVLWTLVAGYRFSFDNEKLVKLLVLIHKAFHLVDMSGGILNQVPFLRLVAPNFTGYNGVVATVEEIMKFLQDLIRECNSNADEDNFISIFLKEINKNRNNKESNFTEKQLLVVLEDFIMAGSETTASTIMFAILYLIKYPEVQAKIHAELDQVVGFSQIPSLKHRSMLVYLNATIMEVQRYTSPVPIAVPHVAMCDVELMGYWIPKGTILLPSLWSVHMDANHWKNPSTFSPDRFIDKNGTIIQDNRFMPFGIGKRKCIGEILAKSVLFCFLANLLQNFKLESPVENLEPTIFDGVTLGLAPFKVKFVQRDIRQ